VQINGAAVTPASAQNDALTVHVLQYGPRRVTVSHPRHLPYVFDVILSQRDSVIAQVNLGEPSPSLDPPDLLPVPPSLARVTLRTFPERPSSSATPNLLLEDLVYLDRGRGKGRSGLRGALVLGGYTGLLGGAMMGLAGGPYAGAAFGVGFAALFGSVGLMVYSKPSAPRYRAASARRCSRGNPLNYCRNSQARRDTIDWIQQQVAAESESALFAWRQDSLLVQHQNDSLQQQYLRESESHDRRAQLIQNANRSVVEAHEARVAEVMDQWRTRVEGGRRDPSVRRYRRPS